MLVEMRAIHATRGEGGASGIMRLLRQGVTMCVFFLACKGAGETRISPLFRKQCCFIIPCIVPTVPHKLRLNRDGSDQQKRKRGALETEPQRWIEGEPVILPSTLLGTLSMVGKDLGGGGVSGSSPSRKGHTTGILCGEGKVGREEMLSETCGERATVACGGKWEKRK